jgi:competence protein ComGC
MIIPAKQTNEKQKTSAFTIIESLFMLLALIVISFIIAGLLVRKASVGESIGAKAVPSITETPGDNGRDPLPAP